MDWEARMRRGGEGGGRAEARCHRPGGRTHPPRQAEAGRREGTQVDRLRRRIAAESRRQGAHKDLARALLGRPRAEDLETMSRSSVIGPRASQVGVTLTAPAHVIVSTMKMRAWRPSGACECAES